jgi:hypothetical protein
MIDAPPGDRRRWWGAFAVLAGLGLTWALAVPVFAAPDEPAHVIRAVAAVHGQLIGDEFGPDAVPPYPVPVDQEPWKSGLAVDVPGVYRQWGNVDCIVFAWNAQSTADCLELRGPDGDRRALTHVGRYPPAYYLATGAVSWLTPAGNAEVYAMRAVSALLCAALLASAVLTVLAQVPRPIALLGLVLALTPTAVFLFGTVNANAVEIAAGVSIWVHGGALATSPPGARDRRLLDRFGVAAVALVLSRPGSLLWLVLTSGVLALVAGRHTLANWWRWDRVRGWVLVVAGATALQGLWFLVADTLDVRRTFIAVPIEAPFSADLRASLGREFTWLRQMVGVFGWLDTPAPTAVLVMWIAGLGAALAVALLVAPRRVLVGITAVLALCVLVPVAYQLRLADSVGYFWQGRYLLPFAAGLPILAAVGAARSPSAIPRERSFAIVLVTLLLVAQWLALANLLRRYSVGSDGTIWFFTAARWDPPVPSLVLLVAAAALLAVVGRTVAARAHP